MGMRRWQPMQIRGSASSCRSRCHRRRHQQENVTGLRVSQAWSRCLIISSLVSDLLPVDGIRLKYNGVLYSPRTSVVEKLLNSGKVLVKGAPASGKTSLFELLCETLADRGTPSYGATLLDLIRWEKRGKRPINDEVPQSQSPGDLHALTSCSSSTSGGKHVTVSVSRLRSRPPSVSCSTKAR